MLVEVLCVWCRTGLRGHLFVSAASGSFGKILLRSKLPASQSPLGKCHHGQPARHQQQRGAWLPNLAHGNKSLIRPLKSTATTEILIARSRYAIQERCHKRIVAGLDRVLAKSQAFIKVDLHSVAQSVVCAKSTMRSSRRAERVHFSQRRQRRRTDGSDNLFRKRSRHDLPSHVIKNQRNIKRQRAGSTRGSPGMPGKACI